MGLFRLITGTSIAGTRSTTTRRFYRILRNIPLLGGLFQGIIAKRIINGVVKEKRKTPVSDVLRSYEGKELEENLEKEAGLVWVEWLKPELKDHNVSYLLIDKNEKSAKAKIKNALREKVKEQNIQEKRESEEQRELV